MSPTTPSSTTLLVRTYPSWMKMASASWSTAWHSLALKTSRLGSRESCRNYGRRSSNTCSLNNNVELMADWDWPYVCLKCSLPATKCMSCTPHQESLPNLLLSFGRRVGMDSCLHTHTHTHTHMHACMHTIHVVRHLIEVHVTVFMTPSHHQPGENPVVTNCIFILQCTCTQAGLMLDIVMMELSYPI